MVSALGRLLRYTVDNYNRVVRLQEELDSVASYIKIQQLRYGERLTVLFDVDESLLSFRVPKLILQPLVENAMYHGIGDREEGGTIWISAVRFEDDLLLTVRDDGKGMTEDELSRLRKSLSEPLVESGRKRGVALRNINQRLVLMYGKEYELHADGSPGEGMAFTITIPAVYPHEGGESDD
jgi:two-component system sensor histidine kinase YesM